VLERRINGEPYVPPMFEAPGIVQGRDQLVATDGATLRTAGAPAWVLADEARRVWVAALTAEEPTPLRLEVPGGVLEGETFVAGRVVWRENDGRVEVESAPPPERLRLRGRPDMRLLLNGEDVTSRLRPAATGCRELAP
jgi:hypothetical protein